MIVGMKYNMDGSRYIATIEHGTDWSRVAELSRASQMLAECDEVYITHIDVNCKPFIDEIVLNGCRIGV